MRFTLKWSDIDEQRGAIFVRRSHWRGVVDETKTGTRRLVPLPPQLAEVLRAHRRWMIEKQRPGLEAGWVFPSRTGGLMQSSSIRKPLKRALDELASDPQTAVGRKVSAHRFRHTLNDLVRQLESGHVARAITGHTTEEMTEHYSFVGLGERMGAVSGIATLVIPAGTSTGTSSPERKNPAGAATPTGRKN